MAVLEYDAIVDAARQGNYTTIQAADDALDGGAYMIYVKSGSYTGFTVSTANVLIICEPGTVITSAIILSGAGVCLVLGAGSDVQALVTLSGVGNSLICENGVDLDGVLCSGASSYVNGGGGGTLSDGGIAVPGVDLGAADCILEDIAVQTTTGGGTGTDGVASTGGDRSILVNVKVEDSDDRGLVLSGPDILALECQVLGADIENILVSAQRCRVIGNKGFEAGGRGFFLNDTSDNSLIVGNIIQDQSGDSIEIATIAENCVVVGNRVDGAIDDNSSTSTVAQNDTEAF